VVATLKWIAIIGAAIAFALCGAWSSELYSDRGAKAALLGLPFAILCTLLTVRKASAFIIFPIIAGLWPTARMVAVAGAMLSGDDYLPMGLAGLIGGFGVAMAVSVGHGHLRSTWRLAGAGAVGLVAGLSFQPWLQSFVLRLNTVADPLQPERLRSGFAIWQAAVGTYVMANVMFRGHWQGLELRSANERDAGCGGRQNSDKRS
jgi:hypothetical protein